MKTKNVSNKNGEKMSIEFLNYEGLQVKYNPDELIVVPLKVTQSKVGDFGEADFQTFWEVKGKIEEVPSYHIKWEHKKDFIEILYKRELNDKIEAYIETHKQSAPDGISYGKEEYYIENNRISYILWYAEDDNGEITKITYDSKKNTKKLVFREGFLQKRKTRTTEQVVRDQSAFRKNLLDLDGKCAVSKISIPEVLQAAHIVAVKDGGFEFVNNGILLRSDLHLLFDSNDKILKIDSEGYVHIDKNRIGNNQEYVQYDGVKIDDSILERVRESLKKSNVD